MRGVRERVNTPVIHGWERASAAVNRLLPIGCKSCLKKSTNSSEVLSGTHSSWPICRVEGVGADKVVRASEGFGNSGWDNDGRFLGFLGSEFLEFGNFRVSEIQSLGNGVPGFLFHFI